MNNKALVVVSIAILLTSAIWEASAQVSPPPTPPPAKPSESIEFLDAHNKARDEVGVGPLKWSDQLAKAVSLQVRYQRDHQNCQFANLTRSRYGGNQMWAGGAAVTPREVVEYWVAEKKYYNHGNNSCVPGHQCGVYTQVVWRKTAELGCGQANCVKDQSTLTICFYNPPGNVIGESPY